MNKYLIGKLSLTEKQKTRIPELHSANIARFIAEADVYSIETHAPLTPAEVESVKIALLALPDEFAGRMKDELDFVNHPLAGLGPLEARNWVKGKVNDLATAKALLADLAAAVALLLRKSGLA